MALRLKRVCVGIYMNHEYGVAVSHETVWSRAEGRKWVASWKVGSLPGLAPEKREQRFDTLAEARAHLERLIAEARP